MDAIFLRAVLQPDAGRRVVLSRGTVRGKDIEQLDGEIALAGGAPAVVPGFDPDSRGGSRRRLRPGDDELRFGDANG